MNIDDYRAMKASESTKESETKQEEAKEETTASEETTQTETKEETQTAPTKFVVDDEEYDEAKIRELKAGNLRTADYTKKTQEAARIRREAEEALKLVEYIKSNPKAIEALSAVEGLDTNVSDQLDPVKSENIATKRELNDLRLRQEIASLQEKHADFEVVEVLQYAFDNKVPNLEQAYKMLRAEKAPETKEEPIDKEALKAELRAELLKELASERDTGTIISAKSTPPNTQEKPTLSAEESRVAKALKLSDEEYMKWKSTKRQR